MIYLKMITRKLDKYIENKNERKFQNLKVSILKLITSSSVLKNNRRY